MLNSLLIFASSYRKKQWLSISFYVLLIINLFITQFNVANVGFFLINIFSMTIITLLIGLVKNKYINGFLSVISILIWSVVVDIASYYMFPLFSINETIFKYVCAGIIFNLRYVMTNFVCLVIITAIAGMIKVFKSKKCTNSTEYTSASN